METAPRDGSRVMLIGTSNSGEAVIHTARFNLINGGVWLVTHNITLKNPTHWMPLPEPPEAA